MKGWMHFVVYYFSIENASAGKLSLVVFIPLDSQEHNKELETSGESKVMLRTNQTDASKLYQKIHGGCQKVGPKVAKFLDR